MSISTGHGRAPYVDTASRVRAALKFSPTPRRRRPGHAGQPHAPTKNAWQHDAFDAADAAEARGVALERLNPGSRFAVAEL
ncbi:hypothetical protein JKA73_31010 [Myxococcus xanthus]|uniref:hypothetical protein n=1 Tax=Myxococcus xanthus TaxID=34 RepID=UPI001916F852|nr:hypothetical protein [Myxococcus xanthus]QQR43425.1 hypothetical protein JKA73_31010 [Myxococcus xanthus]